MNIKSISAFQIYDSRGQPTLEVELTLENGIIGRGLVPSGASTGQFEALELRDKDLGKFNGKSVYHAIGNVEKEIASLLRGRSVEDQQALDRAMIELDGTPSKSRLGANAILGVSMAAAQASALHRGVPLFQSLGGDQATLLPLPEIQIIGGGAHAHWRTDIQDFLIIASGAESFEEVMEMTYDVYHATGEILRKRGSSLGIADEGGHWPDFKTNREALDVLVEGIEKAGYRPGLDICISLDIAASDLFDEKTKTYRFNLEKRTFTPDEFTGLLMEWCEEYPVVSIEDPAADTDWDSWLKWNESMGKQMQIIGDDLFTTNLKRIREGVLKGAANAVLIKLNQIGTVTETMEAIRETQEAGWLPVISARSGETEDAFISHLAVATCAGQLKVGSFARSERMVKWNEVLRIGRHLGDRARFEGISIMGKRWTEFANWQSL